MRYIGLFLLPVAAATILICWLALPAPIFQGALVVGALVLGASLLSSVPSPFLVRRTRRKVATGPQVSKMTAAKWLAAKSSQLGLGLVVEKSQHSSGAYAPEIRTIRLPESEFDSRTAEALATAAHELAHAIIHTRHPVIGKALLWLRGKGATLLVSGYFAVLANLVVPMAWAPALAHNLVVAASLAALLLVLEEACTSVFAIQLLAQDGLGRRGRRAAAIDLALSLLTYGLAAARTIALALLLPWFISYAGPPIGVGDGVGWLGSAATIASAGIVLLIGFELVRFWLTRDRKRLRSRLDMLIGTAGFLAPLATFDMAPHAMAAGHHGLLFAAIVGSLSLVLVPQALGFMTLGALTSLRSRYGVLEPDPNHRPERERSLERLGDAGFFAGRLFDLVTSGEAWYLALMLALLVL